jgi:hypothetical protein
MPSVKGLKRRVSKLLAELDPKGEALAGVPAKTFLASFYPAKCREAATDERTEGVFRDGCFLRIKDCSQRLEEEIVMQMQPVDFARGDDGEGVFLWLAGSDEELSSIQEAYRKERQKHTGKPITWEAQRPQ